MATKDRRCEGRGDRAGSPALQNDDEFANREWSGPVAVRRRRRAGLSCRRADRPRTRAGSGPTLRSVLSVLALAALAAAPAESVRGQSGEQVLRTLLDRYEERMRGVDRYTVVHEVLGSEARTDFEPTRVDGHTVFVPSGGDGGRDEGTSAGGLWADLFELAERSRHRGVEEVDGRLCHVVTVDDFRDTALADAVPATIVQGFEPTAATFHVDTGDHLLRRLEVRGTIGANGDTREVAVAAVLRDYREVEGVLHPFRTDVSVTGLQEVLAGEPSADRPGPVPGMLSSGTVEFTVRVKEIQVGRSGEDG